MPITIRQAETSEDREQVFRFRYEIYVKEMGKPMPGADWARCFILLRKKSMAKHPTAASQAERRSLSPRPVHVMKYAILIPIVGLFICQPIHAASGDLDTAFGVRGKVTVGVADQDYARGVVVQSDGNIVMAGKRQNSSGYNEIAVARYTSSGALDTTFNTTGKVTTAMGADSAANGVALQSDGKILVAGYAWNGSNYDFAVARYTTAGVLDTTFNTTGKVTTAVGSSDDFATGLALQSDGKIVVVGYTWNGSNYDFAAVRYTTAGALDTTFNGTGKTSFVIGTGSDYAMSVKIQTDGKIMLGGYATDATGTGLAIARLTSAGALDSSFVNGGRRFINVGGTDTYGYSLELQADQKIVVAGATWNGADWDALAFRFNTDGSTDTGFGTGGYVQTDFGAGDDVANAVAIQSDGGIVLTGQAAASNSGVVSLDTMVLRYTSAGVLDATFATTGKQTASAGAYQALDYGAAIALQSDGQIVVAGTRTLNDSNGNADFSLLRFSSTGSWNFVTSTDFCTTYFTAEASVMQPDGKTVIVGYAGTGTNSSNDFAVARYNSDGSPDTSFAGGRGWETINIPNQEDEGRAIALQSDGKIVLAGDSRSGGNSYFTAMRLNADGTLDTSLNSSGVTYVQGSNSSCTAVAIQTDSKILLAGSAGAGNDDFLVVRLTSSGVLDTTFNSTGYIFTDFAGYNDYAASVVIQTDGKIVVGGTAQDSNFFTNFCLARYNTNGTLDTSFNSTGKVTTAQGNSSSVGAAALQSDGKIVLAGGLYNGNNYDFALVRYTSSGALDTTFNGTGRVSTDVSFSDDQAFSLLIQGNGKILVGGYAGSGGSGADFALVRYNANGALDTTFSGDGKVRLPVGTSSDYCRGIGTYGGGIVLAGDASVGSHSNFALVKVQSGDPGSLDPTLSSDGVSINPIYSGATLGDGRATSVVLQPDGKIVSAGWMSFSNKDFVITRSNADGTLDSSFGTGGVVKVDFGNDDIALSVALQSDGKIVAAGEAGNGSNQDFAMIRLNTDGTLDSTFGTGGKVTLNWNLGGQAHERVQKVLVQPDGKIVAVGYAYNATNAATFAIARYNSNGTLDSSYGTGGKVTLSFGGGDENGLTAALQSDGKLVVGGTAKVSGQFDCALARFTTSGALDSSFGTAGKLTLGIGADYDEISDLLIQPDGKIFALGTFKNPTYYDLIGLRFNSDGTLDPTFDGDGKKSYQLGAVDDYGKSVALQSDGRIVMAGYFINSSGNSDMGMIRINADGSYDTSFNGSGILTLAPGPSDDRLYGVTIDANNNIVAVGQSNTADTHGQFALVRVLGLPLPGVSLGAVSSLAASSVTLNGTVNPRGTPTTAQFEYGTTTSYGLTASVALTPNNGTTAQSVSASIFALAAGTTYHYRLTATTAYGTSVTSDATFTTALAFAYNSASDVPVTASSYTATGNTASFTLNFAPASGTSLMVVKNTGTGFINGQFGNLAQGQTVTLSYNGALYRFVANYYGGTGNDLVLVWKDTRPLAWGLNTWGQLGNNSTTQSLVPVAVVQSGVLSGKTVVAMAGGLHSLALCSDGTLAAWGNNGSGQLGNNSTTPSSVPVAVVQSGVLSGKTVVAVAAGDGHSLALCSDGTLAAWGYNGFGQLGNNSTTNSSVPVAVSNGGVLSGKTVVAVAVGGRHSVALCSDGTLVAWGSNGNGQLGNNSTTNSSVPVAVVQSGVLSGKTVVAVAAGYQHCLALCSDGTLAAWGYNANGQLGNNSTTQSLVPVAVVQSGVLSGKTVAAVAAGNGHSLALCSDGTLATWGYNGDGQLGNNSTTQSLVPVAVVQSGVLSGKTVVAVAAGFNHSMVLCSDAFVAGWGTNSGGQLGNNSTTNSSVPVAASTAPFTTGERFSLIAAGAFSATTLALAAAPPNFITTAASSISATGATLNGTVNAQGVSTAVSFEYGLTTAYGTSIAATPSPVSGSTPAAVAAVVTGLTPGTAYHYRVSGTSSNGTSTGADLTLVTPLANLSATYNAATDVPATVEAVTIPGATTVTLSLNFAPETGTHLTVINNTGRGFISGQFSNLAQGQTVSLSYGGVNYNFVANYYGGTGNDLVLVWKDSRAFAWGSNGNGQLGDNSLLPRSQAVPITANGVFAGKTVVSLSAGNTHSLALCSDGTVATWGNNSTGQLGNNSTTQSTVPVAVNTTGVLAGKTVVALSAGSNHSLALCSDGTVAAWGSNGNGQLGNNSTTNSLVPVAVTTAGALSGKTVIAIAAGGSHSLALCSDGTLVAWGYNFYGQLGNNSTTQSTVPVAVITAGVLAGKIVTALAAGSDHSLVLCSDGTVAEWGNNSTGQLGNNSTTQSTVPVAVNTTGVLAGKTVVALSAGSSHSLALCSDSTVAAWGSNGSGQLGNNGTANSLVPVAVNAAGVLGGKTVVSVAAGNLHSIALCSDGSMAAWGFNASGRLGNNSITQSNVPVAVDSSPLAAGERFIRGASGPVGTFTLAQVASAPLPVATTLVATGVTTTGATLNGSINAKDNSTSVTFDYGPTTSYGNSIAAVPSAVTGSSVTSVSAALTGISPGTVLHYRTRGINSVGTGLGSDQVFSTSLPNVSSTFNSASDVPVTADVVTIAGVTVTLSLNFAPQTGTELRVVNNTGGGFIAGQFSNLAQGQTVTLNYNGQNYNFVANYYGGTGNDLVLVWKDTRPLAWGWNVNGQLGNNSTTDSSVPVAVSQSGVLFGKTVLTVATGGYHSLALCSDGTLAAWGTNSNGQLGNNGTQSLVPVAVTQSGVLSGKTVVAVSAGLYHSLALCSDGTLAAWGANAYGQLGNNSTVQSNVPVAVTQSGALSGKTVVAVSAGAYHSLALCSDGTLAAWGYNGDGELGNNSTTQSNIPVAVSTSGVLAGKTVVVVAAGYNHNLALCADGTLTAWGYNVNGQLGNNSTTFSTVPVTVVQSGVLSGKTVVAVQTGGNHSLALCSDGTLSAWGANESGQLGNNSTTQSLVPIAVSTSGVLAGKTVVATAAGNSNNLALCSDGTLVAWGFNGVGQLGNNSTTNSLVPVAVSTSPLAAGERFIDGTSSSTALHTLALVAAPPPPIPTAATLAATSITTTGATLNGTVTANNNSTAVTFDYGTTTAYGSTLAGTPTPLTGSSATAVSAALTGLTPGTTYHFRVKGTSTAGTASGTDFVFTTISNNANLASLTLSDGTLSPSFASNTLTYSATVANTVTSLTLTPAVQHPAAIMRVNNVIPNGSANVSLSIGLNSITVLVTAEDGTQKTYALTVTRQSAVETWRQAYFGTSSNSGNAADNADPDGDGLSNYLEWACNLNPTTSGTLNTPLARNGANFEYTYTRSVAAVNAGVTFTVEWSDTLPGTSWSSAGVTEQILSDNGTVQQVKASVPVGSSGRRFVHLTVSGP